MSLKTSNVRAFSRKHGRYGYTLFNEAGKIEGRYDIFGLITNDLIISKNFPKSDFRFTRMFEKQEGQPDPGLLRDLGAAMQRDVYDPAKPDSTIPAGYTYLGQFIAHEVTHNGTVYKDKVDDCKTIQETSPKIDLGSLYDKAKFKRKSSKKSSVKYLMDTDLTVGLPKPYPNDLPREKTGAPEISDLRNDDNVTLAQLHVTMIKFHNAAAAWFSRKKNLHYGLATVKKAVIQHFQSVVFHDFLRTLVHPRVYRDVIRRGPVLFNPPFGKSAPYPAMPIEFALAAFRFGHSMVRGKYEHWNKYNGPSILSMFANTFNNGGKPNLDSDWLPNWYRFFDFFDARIPNTSEDIIYARPIDTRISPPLDDLPSGVFPDEKPSTSMPVRTLLWGRALHLPNGQNAVKQFNDKLGAGSEPLPVLSHEELLEGEPDDVKALLDDPQLKNNTPLWFYILKEAKMQRGGSGLGMLGSRIVMEVLYSLLRCSEHSILAKPGWQPVFPRGHAHHFCMVDLIALAGTADPYSNS